MTRDALVPAFHKAQSGAGGKGGGAVEGGAEGGGGFELVLRSRRTDWRQGGGVVENEEPLRKMARELGVNRALIEP